MNTLYDDEYTKALIKATKPFDWKGYYEASSLGITYQAYKTLCKAEPDLTKRTKKFHPEYFI